MTTAGPGSSSYWFGAGDREVLAETSRLWGLLLVSGVLFLILGFVVLSYDTESLAVTSILLGLAFIMGGLSQFALASVAQSWRWLWILGGVIGLAAGVVAFAYPGETLVVLGLLLGWFLLVSGIVHVVFAMTNRDVDGWWLGLISGAIEIGLGAWAAGNPDRSVLLLITIVGIFCVIRGVVDIVRAFRLRKIRHELRPA